MRKLLNTLYVTTPESYLLREGDNVVVKINNVEKFRIPIHNIEGIVCFGYMGASPQLMRLCTDNNVGLSFLTPHGKFLGAFMDGFGAMFSCGVLSIEKLTMQRSRWISPGASS